MPAPALTEPFRDDGPDVLASDYAATELALAWLHEAAVHQTLREHEWRERVQVCCERAANEWERNWQQLMHRFCFDFNLNDDNGEVGRAAFAVLHVGRTAFLAKTERALLSFAVGPDDFVQLFDEAYVIAAGEEFASILSGQRAAVAQTLTGRPSPRSSADPDFWRLVITGYFQHGFMFARELVLRSRSRRYADISLPLLLLVWCALVIGLKEGFDANNMNRGLTTGAAALLLGGALAALVVFLFGRRQRNNDEPLLPPE